MNITGLHVHQAAKGVNGGIVVSSNLAPFTDADGQGNITDRRDGNATRNASGDPRQSEELLRQPAYERERGWCDA